MSFIKQIKAITKTNKDDRTAYQRAMDTVKYEIEQAAENGENNLELKYLQWADGRYALNEKEEKKLIASLRRMKFKVKNYYNSSDTYCYLISW
jgi:5-hydroxyisourate hydrolase-like protein (transthyretin family)